MDDKQRKVWHEFMHACVHTPEKAPEYLQRYPDILCWRSGVGETVLHHLAVEDYVEAVRLLIGLGAAVNTTCDFGDTPLASAALLGNEEICRLLLEHHANAETFNVNDEAPLHYAARYARSVKALRALLESGAQVDICDDFGSTPLHEAANWGNLPGAGTLLAFGANVKAQSTMYGPPILAVQGEDALALVELFLAHGADLRATNEEGNTLLHHASYHGLHDVVSFCLKAGLDPHAKNNDGDTPESEARRGAENRARPPESMRELTDELKLYEENLEDEEYR